MTPTTRSLLEYWTDPERERRLFFCQVEALETAIYLAEAARDRLRVLLPSDPDNYYRQREIVPPERVTRSLPSLRNAAP